ncbi:MAG: AAA family ATPase [Candidatus Acidiferrales bacterium]
MTKADRGSEWHRWEPHIHAPGTVLEDRYPASGWGAYLTALETALPPLAAIGITDYCITRSYECVKTEKENGRLRNCNLLFPNIELRLNTGTVKGNFVNIHLLVSPNDPDHISELNRFLGQLFFWAFNDKFVCTPADLIRLGRRADPSKTEDEAALRHGCTQFKVSLDNLILTHRGMAWAAENIVIAVAGGADGTSGLKDAADATLREEIQKAAHAIFASSLNQRDFWLGYGKASVKELVERYGGLKPCIWGSDAHELDRVGNPDENRFCWIKGTPTFDALKQACIDPDRAYVGPSAPSWVAPSQIIDEVALQSAPWAQTPLLHFNPGLVVIVGARGSGKTALVDVVAAGCNSYEESEPPSFLGRAAEYLTSAGVKLKWLNGNESTCPLDTPISSSADAYPRARYLSQQFVENLCSVEGMPALIREIERVIFEAHPPLEREIAVDFEELLELRTSQYRDVRRREEAALESVSDQIGIEMDKSRQVAALTTQTTEKEELVARYEKDRKNLLPKEKNKTSERLQTLIAAAETVRGYLRSYVTQQASIVALKGEVQDVRKHQAPNTLRSMKERHNKAGLDSKEWERFLLEYSGDVDVVVTTKAAEVKNGATSWTGKPPTGPIDASGAFLAADADLTQTPLALLEAEIGRLEKLVAADKETANRIVAITKRLTEERTALERLRERLKDCQGAKARASALVTEREQGYIRVFEAVLDEQRVLIELYAPLKMRLEKAGGTLARLSFTVTRVADVVAWAKRGETLFDLRGGPFKGIGSLEKVARTMLLSAWTTGDAADVSRAMTDFRDKHQDALLEKAPYERTDQINYRPWSRRFAQWLYSTDHIAIKYGINYDGVDIRKLSPGTRGIVLLLLYLALDDADDRPLIIDQPEENLDPKSVYDKLVPLFQAAKRKRQVIMVTHNANLVVNADADQVIVAEVSAAHTTSGLPPISYRSGGLEEEPIRKIVCDILEGGELAFRDRARRLRIALAR